MKNFRYLILIIGLFCVFSCKKEKLAATPNLKNPFYLEDGAINIKNSKEKVVLDDAFKIAIQEKNDSLQSKMMLEVSYRYLKIGDSIQFLASNRKARDLHFSIQDSVGIAASYWDLANFYNNNETKDSAYYYYNKGQKLYKKIGDDFSSARLMLNMAMIQKDIKDYTGSEITTVRAIDALKPLNKNKQLYAAYNNLGIVYNELEEYDKALKYYEEALNYLNKADKVELFPSLWNNIGRVYDSNNEYALAAEYYNKGLNDPNLEISDPELYAMLLDNRAYNRFKSGDTTGVYQEFQKALNIRKNLEIIPGIIINKLHLAEFLLTKRDTTTAIQYASKAKELSLKTNNNRDLLASLKFLSNTAQDNSLNYSQQYIKINDSLQKAERSIRNKFARIRFETDEFISETERLSERIIRISLIAFSVLLILILLYIIRDQKFRNRLFNQKQKANQEIYNLVLQQQKNFEEGREKEKHHISRELHDGVLSRLFGVRLSLDALNDKNNLESQKRRLKYIEEIQNIAEEIRLVSHKLNKSSLVDVDFKTVLEEYIEKQNTGKILFQLSISDTIDFQLIDNEIKLNFYRIVQEAITNIHKHSHANKALIKLRYLNNLLILYIWDNGDGLNYNHSNEGIGLKNMIARSKEINGKILFERVKKGTQIIVYVKISRPYEKQ